MPSCWCGNSYLIDFSPEYVRCSSCETLVSQLPFPQSESKVIDDLNDFYGYQYWFAHQEKDLNLPNIVSRARTDLSERCVYWLRSILRYKLPPAQVLELGSAHGGFVALLRWAGFDAMGLEMSPRIVEFSCKTFDIPVLLGPVEEQEIEPGTLDIIVLMDVMEHLPDPIRTMRHCLTLLKENGLIVIQTPSYPERKSYEEMLSENDPFQTLLKESGHLYLFSPTSIRMFFKSLGVEHLKFEPALFSHYDMFLILSRSPIKSIPAEEMEKTLTCSPSRRMVLALYDLYESKQYLLKKYGDPEMDRETWLRQIEELTRFVKESQTQIEELTRFVKESQTQIERLKRLPEFQLRRVISGLKKRIK